MIHNNSAPEVVFTNMGRKYGLCRARNLRAITTAAGGLAAWQKMPLLQSNDTNYCRKLLQSVRAFDLRPLLNDDPSFNSIDEEHVRTRVAALLQSGSIIFLEPSNGLLPESKPVSKTPHKVVEDYEYVDLKHMQSSSEIAINQASTPKASSTSRDLVLDEKALADVLVAAAISGAAFCEMCSKQEEA